MVFRIDPKDNDLEALTGASFASMYEASTSFSLERIIGSGASNVAFRARRRSAFGDSTVVVKVMRPRLVKEQPKLADLILGKEVLALSRLNERIPPTPYVVRMVDAGRIPIERGELRLELPWVAVEHID